MSSNSLYATIVENQASKRIAIATILLLLIFVIGTVGYHYLEDMAFFDGLYMTFITISTIGFTEIKSLSVGGRLFTMLIFVMGIGIISYIASQTTQLLFESELFLSRAMKKKLQQLENHYIICGYGRIGHRIAHVLNDAGLPIVIVENRDSSIERIKNDDFIYVKGNAQEEQALVDAGITQAKALICSLSSDQDNVFTTLLARDLNKDIYVLVRANENSNRKRILRAGADKVISPYDIGADRMANVILRPKVEQFIDQMTHHDEQDHTFDEVMVHEGSVLAGKTLAGIDLRSKYEILIIAIIPKEGRIRFNPKSHDIIQVGDTLVTLGESKVIRSFREDMCHDQRSLAERAEQIEKAETSK